MAENPRIDNYNTKIMESDVSFFHLPMTSPFLSEDDRFAILCEDSSAIFLRRQLRDSLAKATAQYFCGDHIRDALPNLIQRQAFFEEHNRPRVRRHVKPETRNRDSRKICYCVRERSTIVADISV